MANSLRHDSLEERQRMLREKLHPPKEPPMDASATIANIQSAVLQDQPAPEPPPTVTLSTAEFLQMKAQIEELAYQLQRAKIEQAAPVLNGAVLTMEQLAYFAEQLKKPDAETAEKLAQEKRRREQNRQNAIEVALLEVEQKKRREAHCDHKKENGKPAWVGQVHSDGLFHPICQHCQKAATPYKPTPEMMAMGVG
jgi:hypothetical protein